MTRTALFLLATTGLLAAGCVDSKTEPTPGTTSARLTLRRMQTCEELADALKADALAKLNQRFDAMVASIEYADEQGYFSGGYGNFGASPPMAGGARGSAESANDLGAAPTASGDSAGAGSGGSTGGGAPKDESASSYSRTNEQTAGVTEPDFLKTDGTNIYLLHGRSFFVLKAWPSTDLAKRSELTVEGEPLEMFVEGKSAVIYSQVDGTSVYAAAGVTPRSPYQDGYGYAYAEPAIGRADGYGYGYGGYYPNPLTKVTVVDLNGETPTVQREVYFEGSYTSARGAGRKIRTVVTGGLHGPSVKYGVEYKSEADVPKNASQAILQTRALQAANAAVIQASTVADWLPNTFVRNGSAVTASTLGCSDAYLPTVGSTDVGLTQVQAIDLDAPAEAPRGQGIFAAASTVYASTSALYIAAPGFIDPSELMWAQTATVGVGAVASSPPSTDVAEPAPDSKPMALRTQAIIKKPAFPLNTPVTLNKTHLFKFDLVADPSQPLYVAAGTVPGSLVNQFSLDEKNGALRLTTTEQRAILNADASYSFQPQDSTVNDLFVLQQQGDELVTVGSVRDLAPGERAYSTRFVGDRGYLVTFRQVDPLFVFDLSNPQQPVLKASLKIPGFSEYMHPLDDTHLLTIGREADAGGRVQGLALQIFDVTDATAPRQAHKVVYGGPNGAGYSEAQNNHKAFTYFAEKKLLAFPYVNYGSTDGKMQSTLEVFDVDVTAGLTKRGSIDHSTLFSAPAETACYGYFSPQVRRGLFLENFVYSVSYGGVVVSDVAAVGTPLKSLALPPPQPPAGYPVCGGTGVPEEDKREGG